MDIAKRHEILQSYKDLPPSDLSSLVKKARPYLQELNPAALDPLPFVILPDEAPLLERAARQWGTLLTRVHRDLWGEQTLLKEGVLNAPQVWGPLGFDPGFFHSNPAEPLSLIRLDLTRGKAGWRMVSLGTELPRGLGIALETRIAHSRFFGGKVPHGNLVRLAPFLQRLKDLWFQSALTHKDEPAIMVWTEGPSDPLYFEPAYLSRYFGYPLVESRDLTVRSGRVFLKTLGGLQPVDVLIRMVGDRSLDPLAGNPGGVGGVAGLMQAVRDGAVVVTNAPGSGLLEHPQLLPLYGGIARHWDLELPFLTPDQDWGADDFFDEDWTEAPVVVRLFAARFGSGWELMPGGLVQRLGENGPQFEAARKDLWVLASEMVPQVTLLPSGERSSEITRAADLPSRVADDLFWLGRYTERAWVDLRFLEKWRDLHSEGLSEGLPLADFFDGVVRNLGILGGTGPLWQQSRLSDTLAAINRIAGQVLDRLSLETHRILRELGAFLSAEDPSLPETLRQVNLRLAAFSGLTMESMTRAPGWRFLDMGRRLERAMLVIESLQAFFGRGGEENLPVLLDIFDSTLTYRTRYRLAPQRGPVLDLLLLDESNPRSLAFQIESLARHVELLPRESLRPYRSVEERTILDLSTRMRLTDGASLVPGVLEPFLAKLSSDLEVFSDALHQTYLAKIDTMAALQARAGEPE